MVRQTPDELQEHLRDQLGFLRRSCQGFDGGEVSEAKCIAAALRLLLHQTAGPSGSHALLEQLGVLRTMRFLDSVER
jgi:hypothetical protein